MSSRLGKAFVVLTLVLVLGAHWVLLQTAAWVGMAISFSRSEPVSVALEKTFSGKHPCAVCHLVREGRSAESATDRDGPVKKETKLEFLAVAAGPALFPPPVLPPVFSPHLPADLGRSAPPLPPPRAA
jgi:hypothetical protein